MWSARRSTSSPTRTWSSAATDMDRNNQLSQSIVEFAIVAPVLLLLIFGVVDFGRVIYVYATINQGWIFITEPDAPSAIEPLAPTLENAPGGQMWGTSNGTCSATNPAHDHAPLQVTIRYNFVPFTPLIQQVTANHIVISASATYKTEY